jgi:hypothetical protein
LSLSRLSRQILEVFGGVKDFDFIKFFNMRKYAAAILEFGTICIADTGPREAFIKVLRLAWFRTRRQPNTVDYEVTGKIAEREAIAAGRAAVTAQSLASSQAAAGKKAGTGVVSQAFIVANGGCCEACMFSRVAVQTRMCLGAILGHR